MLRFTVGSCVICADEILVVAPVFSAVNLVLAAVTITSFSNSEDSLISTFRLYTSPS